MSASIRNALASAVVATFVYGMYSLYSSFGWHGRTIQYGIIGVGATFQLLAYIFNRGMLYMYYTLPSTSLDPSETNAGRRHFAAGMYFLGLMFFLFHPY